MIVMNEQVISSSEEVSYENLDILDCAVVTADLDLDEEDPQSLNQFTTLKSIIIVLVNWQPELGFG